QFRAQLPSIVDRSYVAELIQLKRSVLFDGDNKSEYIWNIIALLLRWLWNLRHEATRLRGRNDHKDNQEHQQNIYQRCDVDVRHGTFRSFLCAHELISLSRLRCADRLSPQSFPLFSPAIFRFELPNA